MEEKEHILYDKNTLAQSRERFLRILLAAEKRKANVRMYENTNVSGIFESADFSILFQQTLPGPPDQKIRPGGIC